MQSNDYKLEMISRYFSYAEALWLPKWGRMANESDGLNALILERLVVTFKKLDLVCEYFDRPINIHCAYRPEFYNKFVGGAADSAHVLGMAVDFDVKSLSCETAISMILKDDMLDKWNMRLENNGKSPSWCHLDDREISPGGHRYFKP